MVHMPGYSVFSSISSSGDTSSSAGTVVGPTLACSLAAGEYTGFLVKTIAKVHHQESSEEPNGYESNCSDNHTDRKNLSGK